MSRRSLWLRYAVPVGILCVVVFCLCRLLAGCAQDKPKYAMSLDITHTAQKAGTSKGQP